MSDVTETVQAHYTRGDLWQRISGYFAEIGVDLESPSYDDLYPIDQLHGRGIAATRVHAEQAGIRAGMHVLDLGSGLGGASRFLAAEYGCRVTGLDLTQEFVDVAQELTRRCGLTSQVAFRQGSGLEIPFPDSSFDHVWCHNVTMNIEDKAGLAKEIFRVLKPGGRFSCAELNQGPEGEPYFPLPWADDPSSSFLVAPEEMRRVLESVGLRIAEQIDLSESYLAYTRQRVASDEKGGNAAYANHIAMGDDFPERIQNSSRSASEKRIVEQLIVADKP